MLIGFERHTISAVAVVETIGDNPFDSMLSPMIGDRECYRRVIAYLHRQVPGKWECWLETDRRPIRSGAVL